MDSIDKINIDIASQDITFDTPTNRENIVSGDSVNTIFGKISRFFSDLKPVAFSGSYNDLTDKPNLSSLGAAAASHTHNYAGSSSAGGAATSANKLNTNAGSATQPVYFSDGIPKACSYTLGKSVPSNAVFTDTNTWRGIQNNLTSSSATDSLSANMGRILEMSKAKCTRLFYGKSVSLAPGVRHGIVLSGIETLWMFWVAGATLNITATKLHGGDPLSFSYNRTTDVVTINCSYDTGITFIGF